MAYGKKTTTYVDQNAEGKAIALDLIAIADRVGIKGMQKWIDGYKAEQRALSAKLDAKLAEVEHAMDKAGTLDANMALAPWFNFGASNVVRVFGKRHGVAAPKVPASSAASVEALFGANVRKVSGMRLPK